MGLIKKKGSETLNSEIRKKPRDCESLCTQLEDGDPFIRRWAARDLAECPDASKALVSRLNRENDTTVREMILSSLGSIGDDIAMTGLIACLRSGDVQLRNEAIEIMKNLPDKVSLILPNLLQDKDSDVRIFAVNILESLCHPMVEAWLIDVIENDQNINVCAAALDLLVEVGSKLAEQSILKLKTRFINEVYIQFAADLALKQITER